ncbi:MAG: hypothetical protein VKK42_15765 [Lyngbya sp.]|nr:hypothetical protein [Lyngbya sp.]
MHKDYYGLMICAVSIRNHWKWQIALPYGVQLTSNEDYPTAEKALNGGKRWIDTEATFNALNSCMSQLYSAGKLTQTEYTNLIESLRGITQRC